MAVPMGPQTTFHRVWLIIRGFLRRLPTQLWRAAWMIFWRQFPKRRDPKPPAHRSGRRDNHTYPQISIQCSRVPPGTLHELREPDGGLRHERTPYTAHSPSVPFVVSAEETCNIVSDDPASDVTIPIQVLPPEHPLTQSGDLEHYLDPPQDEAAPVEAGLLWSPHSPFTSALNTLPNDSNSLFRLGNASHSPHSSLRSFASIMTTSSRRDISLQNIHQSRRGNGSRVSIIILPVAQPDNDLSELRSLRANSTLEVANHIYPLLPTEFKRYKRNRTLATCKMPKVQVLPVVTDFAQSVLPEGWVQYIHPEGQPIFYNEAKKIITESWIFKEEVYSCLTGSFLLLEDFIRAGKYDFPPDCHLVLDVEEKMEGTDQYWCGYYYISHSTRGIFWLEEKDISHIFSDAETEVDDARIKIQMEYQYWSHWALFSNVNELTSPILDLMANHIRDARTDLLTSSGRAIMPFSLEEINNWANVVRDAREQLVHGEPPTTWFVGRFMAYICDSRFHNFYGQYGARLSRTQSVHGLLQHRRSYLIKSLSPLLFSAPNVHLKVMEGLWVDKLTLKIPWSEFFTQLIEEWKGYTVYASILLNANVAFLAIPSNDPGDNLEVRYRSPTQIASYLSVIASSASMLLALLLLRQYQTRHQSNVEDTNKFLTRSDHPTRGLETLAILYSLPYALLVWGLVTFFLAFFIMCFQDSNTVARLVVGVACFLAAILVVWCIWMGWEESQDRWWSPLMKWTHAQWNSRILRRGLDVGDDNLKGTPEEPDNLRKRFNWLWIRQLGWKPSTSPSDAESLTLR